jgi:hypothetical protein
MASSRSPTLLSAPSVFASLSAKGITSDVIESLEHTLTTQDATAREKWVRKIKSHSQKRNSTSYDLAGGISPTELAPVMKDLTDSVDKLGESHGGERHALVAGRRDDSPEQLRHGFALAFGGDNYTGVQDQAHSVSPASLVQCWRVQRLWMAVDDLFQIAGEVAIEQGRRTARLGGGDDFREQTTGASWNRGTHNSHGARFVLDDDFRTQAYMRHHSGEVTGGLCFRDVDRRHTHDDTSIPAFLLVAKRVRRVSE